LHSDKENLVLKRAILKIRRNIKESNILFQSESKSAINVAIAKVKTHRMELETYITLHPIFRYTLTPYPFEPNSPQIVKIMCNACNLVEIGPMASVAGALADLAVNSMISYGAQIAIVENGGEVSASSNEAFTVGLFTGETNLFNSVFFQIYPSDCPIGIGTSSATISHAINFGEADTVTVFADTAAIADAAATAICNVVIGKDIKTSVQKGLDFARKIDLIRGAFIVRGKYAGSIGNMPDFVKMDVELNRSQISLTEALPADMFFLE
jgi:ApbE superfamily uncharacterized protein (UPF0280 family)